MSFGEMWEDMAPMIGRTLGSTAAHPERGERVILRRGATLEDLGADRAPTAMRLAAAALLGATALTLELPSQGKMAGALQAGAGLTVGGITYKLAADATAIGVTLLVALAAGLQAPAADEAPVAVLPPAYTFEDCHVSKRMRRDIARPLQADHMAVVMVPSKGAPTVPRFGDMLELEDGTVGRVANQVIGGGAFWKLQMGA